MRPPSGGRWPWGGWALAEAGSVQVQAGGRAGDGEGRESEPPANHQGFMATIQPAVPVESLISFGGGRLQLTSCTMTLPGDGASSMSDFSTFPPPLIPPFQQQPYNDQNIPLSLKRKTTRSSLVGGSQKRGGGGLEENPVPLIYNLPTLRK